MKIGWHSNLPRSARVIKALMAAGMILGVALLFLVPPENLPFTPCEFQSLTGHSCLTCGMTRSLHAITHGELITSLRYHLMGPVIFTGVFLFFIVLSVEAVKGRRIELSVRRKSTKQLVLMFAIVWLVYWGARLITEVVT